MHCTPVSDTADRRREGEGRTDRFRALAPRSPARLARSNDPHPVQCNGIVLPNPPSTTSGRRFPAATAKKGWKRLRSRIRGSRGWRVSRRSVSGINHRQRWLGGEGWKERAEERAIVKYNPSSFIHHLPSDSSRGLLSFSLFYHPLQSSDDVGEHHPLDGTLNFARREGGQ